MLEAAREARRQEIEAWRTEQEAKPFTFAWNGRTWNADSSSVARLSPVVMLAKSVAAQTHMVWSDADNQQVKTVDAGTGRTGGSNGAGAGRSQR